MVRALVSARNGFLDDVAARLAGAVKTRIAGKSLPHNTSIAQEGRRPVSDGSHIKVQMSQNPPALSTEDDVHCMTWQCRTYPTVSAMGRLAGQQG